MRQTHPRGWRQPEGSVPPREQLGTVLGASDQLRRVCTAWEEISSSNSFLRLPALPFSPLPELLGRTSFACKSGVVIVTSGEPKCCYFHHSKLKKAQKKGHFKINPLDLWSCSQRRPVLFNLNVCKGIRISSSLGPAGGLFQSTRRTMIPLKQQYFLCLNKKRATQDGLPFPWEAKGTWRSNMHIMPEAVCCFPLSASLARHPIMSCPFADCALLVFIWQPCSTLPFNLSIIHTD